jgi:hypothetical protein
MGGVKSLNEKSCAKRAPQKIRDFGGYGWDGGLNKGGPNAGDGKGFAEHSLIREHQRA